MLIMHDEEYFAVIFKIDGSIMFSQHVSYFSTFPCQMSGPLFLFLLLVIGKVRGVVSTIVVDLSGFSMCKAAIRISLICGRSYHRY
jgi:hypothetical protein